MIDNNNKDELYEKESYLEKINNIGHNIHIHQNIGQDIHYDINIYTLAFIIFDNNYEIKKYLESKLKDLNLQNIYINSINNLHKFTLLNINYERELTDYEICYTLNHIKAINQFRIMDKKYYMIMENNILLNNFKYFHKNIKDILKKFSKI